MGGIFSCPFAGYCDLENGFESVIVKSLSFGDDGEAKTHVRSISFNGRDSEPTIIRSFGSGKMIVEGSISFKRREMETMISITPPSPDKENSSSFNSLDNKIIVLDDQSPKSESFRETELQSSISDLGTEIKEMAHQSLKSESFSGNVVPTTIPNLGSSKHEAALKLQKVYKSFRTRRKLADCAVLVRWWKLLDFAELKRSSISFFDIEKHETAISRWSRARTRAAKVGKGLLKNDKAQKLALRHWLEAIDPRHRYGHNLQFYFVNWLNCQSKEPFFYWLDIGEGKEVNFVEKCPRSKLQQQCIKYLGPMERKRYEVVVEDGKFIYKHTGELLDTPEEPKDVKWIFVQSTSKTLYVGKKKKGRFQHSSFLAGGATSAAGRLVVQNGVLKAIWPHSGHYQPTDESFQEFKSFLLEHNVDLTEVKMSPEDEEEEFINRQRSSVGLKNNSSEEDLTQKAASSEEVETIVKDISQIKTAEMEEDKIVPEQKFVYEQHGENEVETSLTESILERTNSHKEMNSYQLRKQLSYKWTSGAGPRISCVRDYPSELQFRALEQVNLSPRSSRSLESQSPLKVSSRSLSDKMEKSYLSETRIQLSTTRASSPLKKATSMTATDLF